jgi:hypothetical protein
MATITQDIVSGWIKAADGGLSNLELAQKAADWGAIAERDICFTEIERLQKEYDAMFAKYHKLKAADLAEPHCDKWPKCGCPHVYECINGN